MWISEGIIFFSVNGITVEDWFKEMEHVAKFSGQLFLPCGGQRAG